MKKIPRQQQRYRELEAQNKQLLQRNGWLEERVLELEARNTQLSESLAAAQKNSRNSSKPPSSDIVKPPSRSKGKDSKGKARRIGAQKGHPKHERPDFAPDQIDDRVAHRLDRCPVEGSHKIVSTDQIETTLQQVELVDKPFVVTEHLAYRIWCEDCGQYQSAPLPREVIAGGLFGPRLSSFVVFLKGKLHSSYSGIQDLLQDVLGLKVSRGYLAKLLQKAGRAFEAPYEELLKALPAQPRLNID